MLVRPFYPEIKLNLYLGNKIVMEGLNEAEVLNVRKQICEQNLEGYYLKVDSPYWHLYDIETKIMDEVAVISKDGEIENWLSTPFNIVNGFEDRLYGETLHECIGIRRAQKNKEKDGDIHTESR